MSGETQQQNENSLHQYMTNISELMDKLEAIQLKIGPLEFSDNEQGLKGALLKLFEGCCLLSRQQTDEELWEEHKKIRTLLQNEHIPKKLHVRDSLSQQDRKVNIEEMANWVKEAGGETSLVNIRMSGKKSAHPQFTLYACEDIAQHMPILKVPKDCCLLSRDADDQHPILNSISNDPVLASMPDIKLKYRLLLEFYAGSESKYFNYIRSLPPFYENSCYFDITEMELLKGSLSFREALNNWKSVVRQYSYFHLKILDILNSEDQTIRDFLSSCDIGSLFCYEDYKWACATVMTRSLNVKVSTGEYWLGLIPLIDLCDHGDTFSILNHDINDKFCNLSSGFEIATNSEVNLFYGARTNSQFVLNYGFFFEDNSHDFVILRFPSLKTSPNYNEKKKLFIKLGLSEYNGIPLILNQNDPWVGDLAAFMRIYVADSEDISIMFEIPEAEFKSRMYSSTAISQTNEDEAKKKMVEILAFHIDAYNSGDAFQEQILRNENVSVKCQNIVKLKKFELNNISEMYKRLFPSP